MFTLAYTFTVQTTYNYLKEATFTTLSGGCFPFIWERQCPSIQKRYMNNTYQIVKFPCMQYSQRTKKERKKPTLITCEH